MVIAIRRNLPNFFYTTIGIYIMYWLKQELFKPYVWKGPKLSLCRIEQRLRLILN